MVSAFIFTLQRDYTLADVSIIQLLGNFWKMVPRHAHSLPMLPMTFDENAKTNNNVRSFDTRYGTGNLNEDPGSIFLIFEENILFLFVFPPTHPNR